MTRLRLTYSFFSLLTLAMLLMGNSRGRAAAGQGNTGAPGDANITCTGCHGETLEVDPIIELIDSDGNAVAEYIPGAIYTSRMIIEHPSTSNPEAFGFQMIALTDSNDEDVAGFLNPDDQTQIVTIPSTGRQYAEHLRPNSENTFEVEWQAPEAGSGDVTFYGVGNGVDLNGGTSGDGAKATTLTISESAVSSTENIASHYFRLSPNPAQDFISIRADVTIDHLDIVGSTGVVSPSVWTPGTSQIDISNLKSGMYYVRAVARDGSADVQKFIKL